VAEHWVVNASPLIVLAKAGLVDLLPRLCETMVIPFGVAEEVGRGSPDDPAKLWLKLQGGEFLREVGHVSSEVRGWDLGKGESEVLQWALVHPGVEAILDDRAARQCARTLDLPVRGTLGVLLKARKRGLIPGLASVLDQLGAVGFYIHPSIRTKALSLADTD
jgi:predicted nucleic acid-binding protein